MTNELIKVVNSLSGKGKLSVGGDSGGGVIIILCTCLDVSILFLMVCCVLVQAARAHQSFDDDGLCYPDTVFFIVG